MVILLGVQTPIAAQELAVLTIIKNNKDIIMLEVVRKTTLFEAQVSRVVRNLTKAGLIRAKIVGNKKELSLDKDADEHITQLKYVLNVDNLFVK